MRSKMGIRAVVAIAVAGIMIAMSACTLLINHDRQCARDTDCAHFGSHLVCEQGICVRGSLPPGCVGGTPSQLPDFLNHCTKSEYDDTFDNCARLSLCGDVAPPPLVTPPVPPSGTPTSPGPTPLELCADPQKRPQVVFMNGSSNFIPLLQKVAPFMLLSGVTPVFQQTNSCAGVRSVYGPLASQHVMKDPPSTGPGFYASYYPIDGSPPKPCSLGTGVMTDIGESEIFASTCNIDKPAGDSVAEYFGPMATIVFAVNVASTDTAITAEAARQVFGIGDDPSNKATPWTNSRFFYIRNLNTATQQMIAHAIGVPADKFWGTDQGSASNVGGQLIIPPEPTKAIGIIGTDFYEKDPSKNLKALAFRAQGQSVAYWPDSSVKSRDKRNVRDGHYPIWGPLHFFAKIPLTPNVMAFLQLVAPASLERDVLRNYISSSLVPDCAMMVHRDSELEELTPYKPPLPCNCFFEANVPGGAAPPGCTTCSGDDNECPDAKKCIVGFCE